MLIPGSSVTVGLITVDCVEAVVPNKEEYNELFYHVILYLLSLVMLKEVDIGGATLITLTQLG